MRPSRNDWRALFMLSILLAVLALDVGAAMLPSIMANATTGERMAISGVLQDHAGQLLTILVGVVTAAIAMRQHGNSGVLDDENDEDKP